MKIGDKLKSNRPEDNDLILTISDITPRAVYTTLKGSLSGMIPIHRIYSDGKPRNHGWTLIQT